MATAEAESAEPGYVKAVKSCDIIMKGGITSGVVYPLAVCELAKAYRFQNIGGTSAGAIAAAATAAAEYRRRNGSEKGFTNLQKLPVWLGKNLLGLFEPQAKFVALFRPLLAVTGKTTMIGRLAVIPAMFQGFPAWAALFSAPAFVMLGLALTFMEGAPRVVMGLLALGGVIIGALAGIAVGFSWRLTKVPTNFYGICSGSQVGTSGATKPLTDWLSELLDSLAGKPEKKPLTFGDLWNAGRSEQDVQDQDSPLRSINLEMVTTCLTLGKPFRLPFHGHQFYFKEEEFRRLFPPYVVEWMKERAQAATAEGSHNDPMVACVKQGLYPLPPTKDFPVVVAARMSLSFPLLISAIPLYACDFSRPQNRAAKRGEGTFLYERCWFSDGGISSNFPIQFFDQPIPRWPTFGIDLQNVPPDELWGPDTPEEKKVKMPETNESGMADSWDRFDSGWDGARLAGFLMNIFNTMQNWRDNTQMRVPGYRDRVVHVLLAADEGGLNLNMPAELISNLSTRGQIAGDKLKAAFFDPPTEGQVITWDNQRWVRYRSTMWLLEEFLSSLCNALANPEPGDRSYQDLIGRSKESPPHGYRWVSDAQKVFAEKVTTALCEFQQHSLRGPCSFGQGVPKPPSELDIRPELA